MKKLMKDMFLKLMFSILKKVCSDLPSSPLKIKIHKFKGLVANLNDKTRYVGHIRNLKQVLLKVLAKTTC